MVNFKQSENRDSPYKEFKFNVRVDGVVVGGFSEVSPPKVEASVVEYTEGGSGYTHKFVDGLQKTNVVLQRGLTDYNVFFKWLVESKNQPHERRQKKVEIMLLDQKENVVWRWTLSGAFPVRWEGPRMVSNGSGVAIEVVELTFEEITETS